MNADLKTKKNAWTIARLEHHSPPSLSLMGKVRELPPTTYWYALNTVSGEKKPFRRSFDAAYADIPHGEKHNYDAG
jgi:hypothetical protein